MSETAELERQVAIPTSVEQMTTEWFDSALKEKIVGSRILEVIHGTATKVKVELDFELDDGTVEPRVCWIKTGLEPHSKKIGSEKVYAGETFFYRNFGQKYETRTPYCYYADSDDEGNSLIVLDDLCKIGAKFCEPAEAGTPEVIAAGLEAMARYHAATWMNAEMRADPWMNSGGSFDNADCLAWIYNQEHWDEYSLRPRFQKLDPSLRDHDMLLAAHTVLRRDWVRGKEPFAMSHGDAHFGQMYILPSGEARMLDWQCVQTGYYMTDPANLIVSGMNPADRRATDKDLLKHYLGKLTEFGVENPPSLEDAFQGLRAGTMHQLSWVMCLVAMQPEENCAAIAERASHAAMDYNTIGWLLRGE